MTGKFCKNCAACKRLYTRVQYIFLNTEKFYCTRKKGFTAAENVCAEWQKNSLRFDVSPGRLESVRKDIEYLNEKLSDK